MALVHDLINAADSDAPGTKHSRVRLLEEHAADVEQCDSCHSRHTFRNFLDAQK